MFGSDFFKRNQGSGKDLTVVSIDFQLPIVDETKGRLFYLRDTITRFQSGKLVLYKFTKTREFATDEKIPGTEPYFIYEETCKYGFFFESLHDSTAGRSLLVDSVLDNKAFAKVSFTELSDSLYANDVLRQNQDYPSRSTEIYFTKKDTGYLC